MKEFCTWFLVGLAILCLLAYGLAHAAPTIERAIDGKTILLNATACDGIGGTDFKLYQIQSDTVKSGCWHNDGKEVVANIDGVITRYAKQLFELGIAQ